jgi:acyl-CoA dehydrogenase
MDFTPTEEQEAVRSLATQLFATATHPDTGIAGFDEALWARLVEGGLLGLSAPEAVGGGGLPLAVAAVVAEEAGRAAARVPVVPVLAALSCLEDPALVASVLAGEAIVVPAVGTNGWEGRPLARRDGQSWTISGRLLAVAWGAEASHCVVAGRTPDGAEVLLVVDLADSERIEEHVSSREPHATLVFHNAAAKRLGGTAADALTRFTLLQCAYGVGVAEKALELAAQHVSTREQFGRPLATFQAITYQVADCWIDVEAMRLTMQQAVWRVDQGLPSAEATATASFWAADGLQRVVSKAVHLHGGMGVDVSYPLHRWFLIGKVLELSLGGAQRSLEQLGDLLAAR